MKLYGPKLGIALAATLLLAGCGSEQPPSAPPTSALDAPPDVPVMGREVPVLALGDSLLTGYGLDNGQSYPDRLEAALRARGINVRIANAGVSGDTTADGLQRLAFALDGQQKKPELVIISLGGNDMLRGLPPEETRANLDKMLTQLDKRDIPVLLLGMLAAPNMGADYAARFNPVFPALARKHGAALVPFFLQPLMNRKDLVQDDHIHPTDAGIEALVAATVDQVAAALPNKDRAEEGSGAL